MFLDTAVNISLDKVQIRSKKGTRSVMEIKDSG